MDREEQIDRLLSLWQERRRQGQSIEATDLCSDCPALAGEVEKRIEVLRRMEGLTGSDNLRGETVSIIPLAGEATLPPPGGPTSSGDGVVAPGYEILQELGRGGMGVVYKARHLALNRTVALKMILAGEHAGSQEKARFQVEAEAIARLNHPHFVRIFEVGEADGRPFFALELAEGGSLTRRLAGTPQQPLEAARLVEALSGAMAQAHSLGIVHRDLKPGNVLFDDAGAPRITDFGLARDLGGKRPGAADLTGTGAILGTPSYMAPEQAQGKKDIGPAADVYALGAILYECLTGRPPFLAPTVFDTLLQVVESEPAPPRALQPAVPRDLETICLKCLQKLPARRYADAGALADDLGRFLRNEPIRARPAGALYRLGKFVQRNKGPVAGAAASLVAVLLGIVGVALAVLDARQKHEQTRLARAETRQAKAVSWYDQARLDMRQGAWRAALENIDRALESGHPDPLAVRLDRVRAWCALSELSRASEELVSLANQVEPGPFQARVLLRQADLEFNRSAQKPAALKHVQQALDLGLPPGEAAYARALLAATTTEALGHLQEARRGDLYNPRVNGMLALTLVVLGNHREAKDLLGLVEPLFPEDPTFPLVGAMLLALQEDRSGARTKLDKVRGRLGSKQQKTAEALIQLCSELPGLARTLESLLAGDQGGSSLGAMVRVGSALATARAALKDPEGDLYLPLPPVLSRAFQEMPTPLSLTGFGGSAAVKKLARLTEIHPEGFLHLTRGVLLARSDDPAGWSAAEDAFRKAEAAPSIFPLRRGALFATVAAEWVLSREGPETLREARKRQSVATLRRLVDLGPRVEQMDYLTTMALTMGEVQLAGRIVEEWMRQAPKDSRLPRQRLLVAFRSLRYERFLDLLGELVKEPEQSRQWNQARQLAIEGLRKQSEELSKKVETLTLKYLASAKAKQR
jgi:tetratricopeptide (TPR) repeat protein